MSKRKLKSKNHNIPTSCCEVERPKDLKTRIKAVKHDLALLVDIGNRGIMNYEASNQAIGSIYVELTRLKGRLKEAKHHGRR